MIHGIGTDIVHIPRILRILHKYGKKFVNRVYTEKEIEIGSQYNSQIVQARYFAKRFAAKEAFVKALGTGFNKNIKMRDIETCNDVKGRPYIITSRDFISQKSTTYLSISDDADYATAFIVIQIL